MQEWEGECKIERYEEEGRMYGHILHTKLGCATSVVLCTGIIILIFTLFLFTAPEVLRGEDYNHSVDWWSLGIIVYSLLTGQVSRIHTHHFCQIYINT